MPRYFFNVLEGDAKNVARDIEGVMLPGIREVRQSAVDFDWDSVKHGFLESNQKWKVVVTDDSRTKVLTLPLSEIRTRSLVWSSLRRYSADLEHSLGPRALACLIAAALIGIVVEASVRR